MAGLRAWFSIWVKLGTWDERVNSYVKGLKGAKKLTEKGSLYVKGNSIQDNNQRANEIICMGLSVF